MQDHAQQGRSPAHVFAALTRPKRSWLYRIGRASRRYPLGAVGASVLILLVLGAALAAPIAPYDPLDQDIPNTWHPPSGQFWLGTDDLGRDVFSRIMFGSRVSLYVGLVSVVLGTTWGTLVGVASGYFGGRFDLLTQRLVDTLMGFPNLVLAIMMVVALGASINNVTIAIAVTMTPSMVRVSRSSALSVREEVYVLAANAIGARATRIILRHVIPNSLAPVFVLATGYMGTAIVSEASLSFLGLGVPPPHPSWGRMIQYGARGFLESAPWLTLFPGLALSAVVFSFAFFGDALRDALDPKLRGR